MIFSTLIIWLSGCGPSKQEILNDKIASVIVKIEDAQKEINNRISALSIASEEIKKIEIENVNKAQTEYSPPENTQLNEWNLKIDRLRREIEKLRHEITFTQSEFTNESNLLNTFERQIKNEIDSAEFAAEAARANLRKTNLYKEFEK